MPARKKRLPKKLGPYVVKEALGEGGMGEVFLCAHPLLNRDVAVKRLLSEYKDHPEMRERFMREGQALARIEHQGVCSVYDLFEAKGAPHMALEFVDGFDLASLLERGPMPVEVCAIVFLGIAQALESAHHQRIIHRDLKPANVMLSRHGGVKVMDFGVAYADDLDRMTKTGLLVGTPMYMAPEVVAGAPFDERADIYGAGATIFQCLTGQKPYAHAKRENLYAMIEQGLRPPLDELAPHAPPALLDLVEHAMAVHPEDRIPNATALRFAVEQYLFDHHGVAHHAERLLRYLHARGLISEDEATQWAEQMTRAASSAPRSMVEHSGRSGVVLAAAIGIAGVLLLLGALAFGGVVRDRAQGPLAPASDDQIDLQ